MDEVLSTAPDIQDKPDAADLEVTAGAVEYRDVCFSYEDVELGEGSACLLYTSRRPFWCNGGQVALRHHKGAWPFCGGCG